MGRNVRFIQKNEMPEILYIPAPTSPRNKIRENPRCEI